MVEKWESEVVKNAVAKWLICETGSNSKARDLKCNVTVSYEKEIQLMPSYSNAFVVDICSSKIMPKKVTYEGIPIISPFTRSAFGKES